MARGREAKELTDEYFKDFKECSQFMMQMIPCIIPANDKDAEVLKKGLKVITQIDKFIDECDGDLGELSEYFDIDKIVEEYPSKKKGKSSYEEDE